MNPNIIKITESSKYFIDLINLELLLWPEHDFDELYEETKVSKDFYFGYLFDDKLVGFTQVSIRYDYVNGSTTSPVGFLEGIYVVEGYRNQGIGKALLDYSSQFLKEKGCKELGSDALIDNTISHKFHEKMGFKEVERVVCYIRKLE